MHHNLIIDIGNTNTKLAIFDPNSTILFNDIVSPSQLAPTLSFLNSKFTITRSIVSNVAGSIPTELNDFFKLIPFHMELNASTSLPIMNAFQTPETLGVDRIAAVVAASQLFPQVNNLVICAGTCITYNYITKAKTFRGGAITPGIQMRLDAMHHFTSRLPSVQIGYVGSIMGYDTQSCMQSGAVLGAVYEIDTFINEYRAQFNDFNVLLTGGDTLLLESRIKNKIFADTELVIKGLQIILNYNAPKIS